MFLFATCSCCAQNALECRVAPGFEKRDTDSDSDSDSGSSSGSDSDSDSGRDVQTGRVCAQRSEQDKSLINASALEKCGVLDGHALRHAISSCVFWYSALATLWCDRKVFVIVVRSSCR